jgi:predicted RNA-binding protein with PIN domain
MQYLIDGHNLIPHFKGLSLSDPDDEVDLVRRLIEYSRLRQTSINVYFDKAPIGQAGERSYGRVKAIFVPKAITADQAIMMRLKSLGKKARNSVVVSSDRQVQQAARAVHASVVSSEDFVKDWQMLIDRTPEIDPRNQPLSKDEVASWEDLFRKGSPPLEK